ncbi:MAG: UDP-N-acetylglucosamine 2-epimerase (non-hydrolyzing) [Isosphaeraceae bacterium]
MLVCNVVAARPNFMKMAPVVLEMRRRGVDQFLVHTGQHYDANMSDVFFEELGMPRPDVHLGVGSGSHASQTAAVLNSFEATCLERKPDLVVVAGDVNSTLACALTASKLQTPVAHVEAGLRSFDRRMPEEVNRVLTDHISDLLFATEDDALTNLAREGVDASKVHLVGNCMVDSLMRHVETALDRRPWERVGLNPTGYALVTLHRPSNVDDEAALRGLINAVNRVSDRLDVVFPVHPRTRARMEKAGVPLTRRVHLSEPMPYVEFLGLMARARCVLTDSGGIQEETTALGVPCLTLRENTERPVTIRQGTNRLIGADPAGIEGAVEEVLAGRWPGGVRPALWDGHAARRIVDVVEQWSAGRR